MSDTENRTELRGSMNAEIIELASGPEELRLQCEAAGSPQALFACWTTPALLERWWPQRAEVEPRVGGAYHLSWSAMGWSLRGHYLTFEPGARLSFTWRWDHDPAEEPDREVAISFAPAVDGADATQLLLTHSPYGASASEQTLRVESHLAGWRHFLPRLIALASDLTL